MIQKHTFWWVEVLFSDFLVGLNSNPGLRNKKTYEHMKNQKIMKKSENQIFFDFSILIQKDVFRFTFSLYTPENTFLMRNSESEQKINSRDHNYFTRITL